MSKKSYTVLVVPDRSSHTTRFRVPQSLLVGVAVGIGLIGLASTAAWVHYGHLVTQAADDRILKEENAQLRSELQAIREKVFALDRTVDRVEKLDQKLRAISSLSDPDRKLAIGPVSAGSSEELAAKLATLDPEDGRSLDGRVDQLAAQASKQEQSLQELEEYFHDQKSLLASAPSIWPARGWVTSDFGSRLDPYTAERVMHKGLDIAAPYGSPVQAPADGTVVFASMEGGYGKVLVIDHGYGIKTRYGHLSELFVKAGVKVKRGDRIAACGNTGRSTGPHVHYEVRVHGVPENPRKFILE